VHYYISNKIQKLARKIRWEYR